jgi:hypothetical protein
MSQALHTLTHGLNGLILGYATVMIPMVVGLRRGRAPVEALFRGPLWAIPATVVAGILIEVLTSPFRDWGVNPESGWLGLFGALVSAGVGYAGGRLMAVRKRPPDDAKHRRGAVVMNSYEAAGSAWAAPASSDRLGAREPRASELGAAVTVAGIPVAFADETKHFKLIGTTGTGKSTAIRELLQTALARGDRAVIADPDGGYLNTFYDAARGDVILNPFSPGSAKWSLLGEITNDYDVEQLARSLIPDSGDPDRVWSDYARTFFIAVVQQVIQSGIKDDSAVDRLFNQASEKVLRDLLAKTSAAPMLAEGNEKMFGGVRSITTSALRSLKYVTRQQGAPFSVRTWVSKGSARQAGGSGGVLFLPYKAGEIAALRSMISAWMRLAIFEAMNREEGDQRLWFVIDELDALGEIDGLKDALARLRKFGGRGVVGLQSIAQVSSTYGKGVADTIVENCGNTLILRCSASEHGGTSEFASKLIGQREVTHTTRSRTRRAGEWRASTTTSEQVKIEPAVMSSEIERLPDLEGFLKFASVPDWQRVTLIPLRGFAGGENKQRVAAAGPGGVGVVLGGAPANSEPVVTPSAPRPGDGGFAAPPSGGGCSVDPPPPRAFKKATRTPTRKPRVKRSDSDDVQVGTSGNDVPGTP